MWMLLGDKDDTSTLMTKTNTLLLLGDVDDTPTFMTKTTPLMTKMTLLVTKTT